MIVGIGHDLCHAPRIARAIARYGERFLDRVFDPEERHALAARRDPAPGYAARFAAKEAFYKALSRGRPLPIGFRDAWVVHPPGGLVELRISARARELCDKEGVTAIHLSLSHDGEYGSAVVVLERVDENRG